MSGGTSHNIDQEFIMVRQCISTLSSDSAPKDIPISDIRYQEIYTPYYKSRPSYILAEGVGVRASYNLRGHVTLEDNILSISGMGRTSASRVGSVDWFMSATILDGGVELEKKTLAMEGVSAWPDDDFDPIGHVSFELPLPPRRLSLVLKGGYYYTSGSGQPASGIVDIPFDIEVEAR